MQTVKAQAWCKYVLKHRYITDSLTCEAASLLHAVYFTVSHRWAYPPGIIDPAVQAQDRFQSVLATATSSTPLALKANIDHGDHQSGRKALI